MPKHAGKKLLNKHVIKEQRLKTVPGISLSFHAMNLMLEAASSRSMHGLTRDETLLLLIVRGGIVSRKSAEEKFRNLQGMQPESVSAQEAIALAFEGLVEKGLINSIRRSVQITRQGRAELRRMGETVDTVYDKLIENLPSDQKKLQALMRRIGRTRSLK
jgi:hypothetical protein